MKKIHPCFIVVLMVILSSVGIISAHSQNQLSPLTISTESSSNGYGIQWIKEYGSSPWTDARYQGPQPIGDCDNDGLNELLISGRDSIIRVMKWNEKTQTYDQVRGLRPPFYPFIHCDAGGMAIGDVTNDGKNEIAATWFTSVYRYFAFKYWMIGMNPFIFKNNGGSADCLIGDCDNDGENELILSGGPMGWGSASPVAEITVFRWNGLFLKKVAEWKDPEVDGYVYMAGLGDVDEDGENEIVCAYENKVVVLNWDAQNLVFVPTEIYKTYGQGGPFGIVCKDCDNDGAAEILLSYYSPRITIFKWNGTGYPIQFDKTWPGGDPVIEGIDVGDTDDDGLNEVVAGAGLTYVLQWNGSTYVEEAVLPTFGWMAVVCIGDCDNDGKNEINAGNVEVNTDAGEQFTEWVFKYGWEP
ncbi:MAG: VCBS repeat-containing protein [Candidatus Thermoplasmatota archaeon]